MVVSKQKIIIQIICIIIVFFVHQWLTNLSENKNNYYLEILSKVGNGTLSKDSINLTFDEKEDLKAIINANPNNYNAAQKAIIQEKLGVEILTEIGMGKKKAEDFTLSKEQFNQIDSLIKNNPNNYNSAQKSILLNRNN